MSECATIVKAVVQILRQHMRLQPGGIGAGVTIAIDDLTIITAARTGLAVGREEIRNLVDAMVHAGILRRHPAPRYMASSYSLGAAGTVLDAQVEQFLLTYRPRWEPFKATLPPIAALVAHYEALYRSRRGGLPRAPDLPEVAQTVRLNGLRWLERRCAWLEQQPVREARASIGAPNGPEGSPSAK